MKTHFWILVFENQQMPDIQKMIAVSETWNPHPLTSQRKRRGDGRQKEKKKNSYSREEHLSESLKYPIVGSSIWARKWSLKPKRDLDGERWVIRE